MYRDEPGLHEQAPAAQRAWLLQAAPRQPAYRHLFGIKAVIVLLLLVTWLGARGLDADALWYDEVWSLYYAGGAEYGPISPAATIERVVAQLEHEKNPPGYYVLLNAWGSLVGWSEFGGRALSLFAGLLAVAWSYRLGYDLAFRSSAESRRLIGLGTAAAVGGSAFFAYYLHEQRVYAMVVLSSALILWAYWRLIHSRKPNLLLSISLVLGIAAALYLYYMTILVVGAVGLYHLILARKDRRWWWVLILLVAGGAMFLPWVIPLMDATIGAQGLETVSLSTPEMLAALIYVFSNASVVLLALIAIFATGARGKYVVYAGVVALGGVALAALLNSLYPVVTHIRYVIALWPALALVVGLGVERLARRGISPVWILGLWMIAGVWNTIDPSFNRALSGATLPWREFRSELIEHGEPNDIAAFHAPDFNWFRDLEIQHYMNGLPMRYSLLENIPGLQADDEYYHNAVNFTQNAPRVWVGIDRMLTPNFRLGEFERVLTEDYIHCLTAFDVPDMSFDLYARVPAASDIMPYQFGEGIGMQLLEPIRVLPNGGLSILSGWRVGEDVPPNTYSVSLHVLDQIGNLAAQADHGLPEVGYHCSTSEIVVPPGEYTVMALVYNWQTGERLTGIKTNTDENGDQLPIATIAVE